MSQTKQKVLIVDDDWGILELLKIIFLGAGFDVLIASHEEDFRDQALSQNPDVIVLDLILGRKDGAMIYDKLLHEGLNAKIPVIFLTALADSLAQTPAQPGRTYALMGKPFDPDKLIQAVRTLLLARAA